MSKTKGKKKKVCVLCEKELLETQKHLFSPLKYFDDQCLCNECLRKEKEGSWTKRK